MASVAVAGAAAKALKCEVIASSSSPPKRTVIWMHGLGDSSAGFRDVFRSMLVLPDTRIVLPNAPTRPITCNGGMRMQGWYDIRSISERAEDMEDAEGIAASARLIAELLDEEAALVGGSERITIGGFSQGAAMAVYAGLAYPAALGSIVAFSGYLVRAGEYPAHIHDAQRRTRLFISNGGEDGIVSFAWAKQGWDLLRETCALSFKFTTEPRQGHELTMTQLQDLQAWILDDDPPSRL